MKPYNHCETKALDPIENDDDLKCRMELIDELYSHADTPDHPAARFAERVVDRVYEYEAATVLIPDAH